MNPEGNPRPHLHAMTDTTATHNAAAPPKAAGASASGAPPLGMAERLQLQRAQHKTNNLLWGIFVLLLILVGGVMFVLPNYVSPAAPETVRVAVTPSPAAATEEAPFEQAQRLRQREEAQAALAPLLELQDALERKQVRRWAETEFDAAITQAHEGDTAYAAQDYATARDRYQAALTQLQQIDADETSLYANFMSEGDNAYAAGDAATAEAAYGQALLLQPGSAQAVAGMERAQALGAVLELLETGRKLQADQQLDAAREQYRQAQVLDAAHPDVRTALNEVERAIVDRNFAGAMSRGYTALQAGNAAEAQQAFQQALGIKPGAGEANAALAQARDQQTFAALNVQVEAAERFEAEENWAEALAAWDRALEVDPNLVSVQQGQRRSQSRNNLDVFLRGIVDDPLRLATPDIHAQATQVLADARQLPDAGPKLREQLQTVQTYLQQALVPATVQLQSDGVTSVTLLRVGELGAFTNRTLDLTPGTYTAMGVRPGYRDVRQEFQVSIDGRAPMVTVACSEAI